MPKALGCVFACPRLLLFIRPFKGYVLERLKDAFAILRREGDLEKALKEVERALLLADVDVDLVFELVEKVKKRAKEEKAPPGVPKSSLITKILYEEIVSLFGERREFPLIPQRIMLIGLFGSGKTTTAGKLARIFQKNGLKSVLICLDTHRPAASEQLRQIAEKIGVEFFFLPGKSAEEIADASLNLKTPVKIYDTAGRSTLDDELMEELMRIKKIVVPEKTLLVIPADAGQGAGREAKKFAETVGIDGVIITKMDGSGKGGGALAACAAARVPVYFIGTGEKLEDLEPFDPEKFVSRLLGIPDLEGLLRQFEGMEIEEISPENFDINAFHRQLMQAFSAGPIDKLLASLGISVDAKMLGMAKEKLKKYDAIYKSMTKQERAHPEIINASRIKRIARGSGTTEADVRAFLRDYERAKKMLKRLKKDRRLMRRLLGGAL